MENSWHIQIFNVLEKKKESIEPGDFKFYNIAHFPLLAKYTEIHAKKCKECSDNTILLNEIVDSLPEALSTNASDRKLFETKKTIIENHLKKAHNMRFPGLYTSLLSLIGILIGFLISLALNYIFRNPLLNDLTLIGLAVGLVGGVFVGRLFDKNIFLKNLQL
jgi:hypothetical protein